MASAIIPERFREEYRSELKNIFAQRVNLFCYIAISAFTIDVIVAWFLFRRLLGTKDMPGILGGAFFCLVLLTTGKFAKKLASQKIRGFFFSIIIISVSILAAAAHPDVITNLGITIVLKDYAAIKRDVMIIGVSNRIEVWARDAWMEYYNSSKESFEEIAEKLMTEEN